MNAYDQKRFEFLKGRILTKKKSRYYFFSCVAGRNMPVKKVIAEALIAGGHCDLNT